MDDDSGSEELDGPLATIAGVKQNRLKAIQYLIEKKRQKKDKLMKAKLSHSFIN